MKSIILTALLLLAGASSVAMADPPDEDVLRPRIATGGRWFIQFDLGLNVTWMNGNPALRPLFNYEERSTLFESASGISPLISGSVGYRFNPEWALVLRLDYDPRHTSNSATSIDTCQIRDKVSGQLLSTPTPTSKEFTFDVNYFSISLLPEFTIDNTYLFAGPTISLPLSRKLEETDRIIDTASACLYFAETPDSTRIRSGSVATDKNMKTRISFKIGAGYNFRVAPTVTIVPQIGFDFGLTTALTTDAATGTFETMSLRNPSRPGSTGETVNINDQVRLNSLQASIGVRINL